MTGEAVEDEEPESDSQTPDDADVGALRGDRVRTFRHGRTSCGESYSLTVQGFGAERKATLSGMGPRLEPLARGAWS